MILDQGEVFRMQGWTTLGAAGPATLTGGMRWAGYSLCHRALQFIPLLPRVSEVRGMVGGRLG